MEGPERPLIPVLFAVGKDQGRGEDKHAKVGFVFLLPALLGPDGIWLAVDAADFCMLILATTLILAYRKKYGY